MNPTARELLNNPKDHGLLAARIEKVLALHREGQTFGRHYCLNCGADWPCPTMRLLDGEEK